jgi:type II secretory pathway predicted ATPase ExeA
MIEEYLEYWGLGRHPFLLAPDSGMMCVTGQYYESLERLKYAINTGKGGVLLVSEDAGLGKTTLLLKLIDDMKERYGDTFRHAFVDHPTLSASQMIARIAGEISGIPVGDDKLKNLTILKESLIDAREQGGKSIIIVDEGQLLCESHDILQELRILINLTHRNEYLHTFILSGQRALWHTIKGMPEFWQRLPVRYYFMPLKLEETKELIRFRLRKAGVEEGKDVFQDDALEIIHRYSKGSPRTIIALSDLSLLVGYTNRAGSIGFKEVSKAISAMSGQGESLPYVAEEGSHGKGPSLGSVSSVERPVERASRRGRYSDDMLRTTPWTTERFKKVVRPGPVYVILALIALILAGTVGYFYVSDSLARKRIAAAEAAKTERMEKLPKEEAGEKPEGKAASPVPEAKPPVSPGETGTEKKAFPPEKARTAVVLAEAGNVRSAPELDAPRIGVIFKDETIRIVDEKADRDGGKWYMFLLYGEKEGWISDRVVEVRAAAGPKP